MKYAIILHLVSVSVLTISAWGTEMEISRVVSLDGRGVAVLTHKNQTGIWLPGPEPPKVHAQWVRFTVNYDGKTKYDSKFQDIGVNQPKMSPFDIIWSPDSSCVAYRFITELRIISQTGIISTYSTENENSLISSYKWINNNDLVVVSKRVEDPLGMFGYKAHYHGYLTKAKNIRIFKYNKTNIITNVFLSSVDSPTFMYHSIGFENTEISPSGNRIAYSNGKGICVFDIAKNMELVNMPIIESIEGTWWETDDRLIVGIGLLSSSKNEFMAINILNCTTENKTAELLPIWDRMWNNENWFRTKK